MLNLPSWLGDALNDALRHVPFHSETHAIKGVLALKRLRAVSSVDDDLLRTTLDFRELLAGAKVDVLVHEHVSYPTETLEDSRLQRMIEAPVFPMAYAAGAEWVKRHGYKHMVEHYKDRAIERIGFLGHSWSIWCSFLEVEPYLTTDLQQRRAAERFVEFCAPQLSSPHWTVVYDIDFALETHELDEDEIITSVLSRPGFYGHTVIALAHILEYESLISPVQRRHAMKRMYDVSQKIRGIPVFDVEIPRPAHHNGESREQLDKAILGCLKNGSKEVHTVTLAAAILMLWNRVEPGHRAHLLAVLNFFAEWKIERTVGGEQKSS